MAFCHGIVSYSCYARKTMQASFRNLRHCAESRGVRSSAPAVRFFVLLLVIIDRCIIGIIVFLSAVLVAAGRAVRRGASGRAACLLGAVLLIELLGDRAKAEESQDETQE